MPKRKRRSARERLSLNDLRGEVAEKMRRILDPVPTCATFFMFFTTEAERRIAREEHAEHWYGIFGFWGEGPFMRKDPVRYFGRHKPKQDFEPPDLSSMDRSGAYFHMHTVRARWWIENGLPLTRWDEEWLRENRPELLPGPDYPRAEDFTLEKKAQHAERPETGNSVN